MKCRHCNEEFDIRIEPCTSANGSVHPATVAVGMVVFLFVAAVLYFEEFHWLWWGAALFMAVCSLPIMVTAYHDHNIVRCPHCVVAGHVRWPWSR